MFGSRTEFPYTWLHANMDSLQLRHAFDDQIHVPYMHAWEWLSLGMHACACVALEMPF